MFTIPEQFTSCTRYDSLIWVRFMGRIVVIVTMRAQHGVCLATASLPIGHDTDVVSIQERGQHGLHFIKHCLLCLSWVVHSVGNQSYMISMSYSLREHI